MSIVIDISKGTMEEIEQFKILYDKLAPIETNTVSVEVFRKLGDHYRETIMSLVKTIEKLKTNESNNSKENP